ncbi:MAG: hypothetical protein ACM3XM_10320 [Mycobacterium leprae]
MLDAIWTALNPPPHANIGEAYMLHESLAAFYFLRAKSIIYETHCQSAALKSWWEKARVGAFDKLIDRHVGLLKEFGVPLPGSMSEMTDLNDQFMAVDGAAMVKGMLESHIRGLQSARRPDVAALYRSALDGALIAGAQLLPIVEKEGLVMMPPAYPAGRSHD